jgi:hypothetical protein
VFFAYGQPLTRTAADEVTLQLANTTAMCAIALPIGVRVSIPVSVTTNRQPCSSDRRISRAKSSVRRLARSTLVKISASDSPASSSASAA